MDYSENYFFECGSGTIVNCLPEIGRQTVVAEILAGLRALPKRISSKFFYDRPGSELFQKITRLDEYYPSRTEKAIFEQLPLEAVTDCRDLDIIELGSGDHSKISLLLKKVPPGRLSGIRYFPVDISRPALESSIRELGRAFPELEVQGIVADYFHQMHLVPGDRRKLFCFLGSTIGNLERDEANAFVRDIGGTMEPGDAFLTGFDRVKDTAVLERAYNDAGGLTARFNRNVLNVVNGLIESDFNPLDFEHRAFYNRARRRIEMHLEATRDIRVRTPFAREEILVGKGERIHTENSHKFDDADIQTIAEKAGLAVRNIFSDQKELFSLALYGKDR
ncbi:L-histidine N(alpha)-methyltransferase [Prosthecochloris sp. GSB1]|uniref:L-histidine N(alpha)-methyltransferase n=1 Tax=Prosthecochloris sp. GSB1 TaxID=281093 RepID=UPI000B8C91D2|nr:L-histidine N(alpha)-methyltransferase [Prosthecochloris sp. GSB1]ASQ90565.1 L-histidine N(alpha)-methyltransferase [Prosthecochloris sp. GSB1]